MVRRYKHKNQPKAAARRLLVEYPANRSAYTARERDILYRQSRGSDGQYRRGGISNPTQLRAIALAEDKLLQHLRSQILPVEQLLAEIAALPRARERKLLQEIIRWKYFAASCSIAQTAARLGISEWECRRAHEYLLSRLIQLMQQ